MHNTKLKITEKDSKQQETNGTAEFKVIRVTPLTKHDVEPQNSCLENFKLYCVQYCKESTVHGVKYIGEQGRYLMEKLLWAVIVIVVCTFCLMLISRTYRKWETSPVIVTFATQETSISKIPFPAVTICPEAKFNPEMLPNFDPHNLTSIKWLGEKLDSNQSLSLSITSEGICYTFNMLPYEEIVTYDDNLKNKPAIKSRKWSLEKGYSPNETFDVFPRRTFTSGFKGGLTIEALNTNNSHLDYICGESLQGYKVALHHPCELPNMDRHFRLPLNQAVLVAIKPEMITVSSELWNYSPQDRKCYFAEEKYLASYKIYTHQNCLDECLANYTLSQCKCIPFYSALLSKEVEVCGPANNDCVMKSKQTELCTFQVKYLEIESQSKVGSQQCHCLPLCTSLSYDVETSQTDWDWQKALRLFDVGKELNIDLNPKSIHFSKLIVYYKQLQFMSCERNELYGLVDFFSNVGGLLGLFIGFSVISAVEIIHFCTVRILCNIRKYGKNSWSGEPKVVDKKE
ncbi:hypothetical protein RI129_010219 [Pyrocoelia pectoralis]|uniref:Uncharacterized protein n=1 Tax=Pyrocoelia pectoralis TaxID=417401 RepID=A0AAN7ZFL0_9COLE